jgi:triacylglycerol lipase
MKYPVVLVHGVAIKEKKPLRAFGKIADKMNEAGYEVYIADVDAFGTVKNNALQLKNYILRLMEETGAKKVNLIGYSKGGLDAKMMIEKLDMAEAIASLTTVCTPHRGSVIATMVWGWPQPIKKLLSGILDFLYKHILKDEHPDSMTVCCELCHIDEPDTFSHTDKFPCRSYSTVLKRGRDCLLMAPSMKYQKRKTGLDNDGMVSVESAKFGEYRGNALDGSISHLQIIDLFARPKTREGIFKFYISICQNLEDEGL